MDEHNNPSSSGNDQENSAPENPGFSFWGEIKSIFKETLEFLLTLALAVGLVLFVRAYVIQPFIISGDSMFPNFINNELIVVNELTYHFEQPQRGDVIVFKYPLNTSEDFIKRVIGLPGETVSIKDGKVYIYNAAHPNGIALNESQYLNADVYTGHDMTMQLGPNQYFVMGDNRPDSRDSRFGWNVPRSDIIGKVFVVVWPFNDAHAFQTPTYNISNH